MSKIICTIVALLLLRIGPESQEEKSIDVVNNFLSKQLQPLQSYTAIRHMVASNNKSGLSAFLNVRAELSDSKLTFNVISEGGSGFIRNKVLREILQGEQKHLSDDDPKRSSFSPENYIFDSLKEDSGTWVLTIRPKRNDKFLIDGHLVVNPNGDLIISRGNLVKDPSFWTKKVHVEITYATVSGVRLPVCYRSVSSVRLAGKSSTSTTYFYLSVNGISVIMPVLTN
jgi:hypothetical protein